MKLLENKDCDSVRLCRVTPSFSLPFPSSHCSILIRFSFITGSGVTINSIFSEIIQLLLILLVTVTDTDCVLVLKGFGKLLVV